MTRLAIILALLLWIAAMVMLVGAGEDAHVGRALGQAGATR